MKVINNTYTMLPSDVCQITVVIPTKNEALNLPHCLKALNGWADEIIILDSQSSDGTNEIAQSHNAQIVQFHYKGGWPKKRQWALDNLTFRNEWILLLDADEILLEPVKQDIGKSILSEEYDGYWLSYEKVFLNRQLRFGETRFQKLTLFRKGKGKFEKLLEEQDTSMADMEVHEHVLVDGKTGYIKNPVRHENFNSLFRYIEKHNEYSNWAAKVMLEGETSIIPSSFWRNPIERRHWLKKKFFRFPGAPILAFLYYYIIRCGFLDGIPGLIHSIFWAIQNFHTNAKIYELKLKKDSNLDQD